MNRAGQRWQDLPAQGRAALVGVAALDVGLRAWALADLRTRPAGEVAGPKAAWAAALGVVSSAGVLPAVYLLWGRRSGRHLLPLD
ncbi:hypothetical protein [Phycicoccus duodecadis]|uniref:DUF5652 domain-containing protein n=1 Tax=Phycicoccus duodecadis TaxID=173053 RepID=A0A2N3YGK6_9MICO|nr:hypothetical protein [Phycicoccus duodecadis]PKW25950.1 hypothetical protein ATL31_0754 [Phycicoccus duodecadis]